MSDSKTTTLTETLTTTVLRAEALAEALQALHRQACNEDPMLALLVGDLISRTCDVKSRLREISAVTAHVANRASLASNQRRARA